MPAEMTNSSDYALAELRCLAAQQELLLQQSSETLIGNMAALDEASRTINGLETLFGEYVEFDVEEEDLVEVGARAIEKSSQDGEERQQKWAFGLVSIATCVVYCVLVVSGALLR